MIQMNLHQAILNSIFHVLYHQEYYIRFSNEYLDDITYLLVTDLMDNYKNLKYEMWFHMADDEDMPAAFENGFVSFDFSKSKIQIDVLNKENGIDEALFSVTFGANLNMSLSIQDYQLNGEILSLELLDIEIDDQRDLIQNEMNFKMMLKEMMKLAQVAGNFLLDDLNLKSLNVDMQVLSEVFPVLDLKVLDEFIQFGINLGNQAKEEILL